MDIFSEIIAFAREHRDEDPLKLLLQQKRHPSVDLKLVAQQLEGQRQASAKWPTLARCADYFYPPKLNREQSSSEATARYKAQLFQQLGGGTLADLTGGMGVDSFFMAQEASHVDYFELNSDLAPIVEHNFQVLGQNNITCHQGDSIAILQDSDAHYDMILIDPARRDDKGRKVAAFEDCTPNLLANLDLLLSRCRHLLVKASPMIDIHQTLQQLGVVGQVHIVALNNECKEVLFLLSDPLSSPLSDPQSNLILNDSHNPVPTPSAPSPSTRSTAATNAPTIHCLNLHGSECSHFSFQPQEEAEAVPTFASQIDKYLYEPNATLMKGGCFNLISQHYCLDKLARNTHLYTSDRLLPDFPGRIFQVLEEVPLNAKKIAPLLPDRKAHVVTRNYPLSSDQLHQKLKLSEGGTFFLLAATLATTPRLWLCRQHENQ